MRIYKNILATDPDFGPELYTVKEWLEDIKNQLCCNSDGSGYWVKDNLESNDEVFNSQPEDASHVAWYNK